MSCKRKPIVVTIYKKLKTVRIVQNVGILRNIATDYGVSILLFQTELEVKTISHKIQQKNNKTVRI